MLTTTILLLNRWAGHWFEAMAAVLWQSTLLIAIATLATWWLRRSSPSLRYWIWQIVALKLLLMPLWTFAVPVPSWAKSRPATPSPTTLLTSTYENETTRPELPKPARQSSRSAFDADTQAAFFRDALHSATWQAWLFAAWLAVLAWQVVRLVVQRQRLAALLRHGDPAGQDIVALVAELARQVGLRHTPTVVLVDGDCPLFVCGLWRPTLVLPNPLLASLGLTEARQVLLHELAHLKRRDLIWGWPIEIAKIAYFFNPLVYWVSHQLRLQRELACDHWAIVHSGRTAADYAQTLIQVVSHGPEPAMAQSAAIAAGLTGSQSAAND
jgi:beta-lactamase regulating signal transducer with metallopeptidase domain